MGGVCEFENGVVVVVVVVVVQVETLLFAFVFDLTFYILLTT